MKLTLNLESLDSVVEQPEYTASPVASPAKQHQLHQSPTQFASPAREPLTPRLRNIINLFSSGKRHFGGSTAPVPKGSPISSKIEKPIKVKTMMMERMTHIVDSPTNSPNRKSCESPIASYTPNVTPLKSPFLHGSPVRRLQSIGGMNNDSPKLVRSFSFRDTLSDVEDKENDLSSESFSSYIRTEGDVTEGSDDEDEFSNDREIFAEYGLQLPKKQKTMTTPSRKKRLQARAKALKLALFQPRSLRVIARSFLDERYPPSKFVNRVMTTHGGSLTEAMMADFLKSRRKSK